MCSGKLYNCHRLAKRQSDFIFMLMPLHVPRLLGNNWFALSVMAEWANMSVKRAVTQFLLLSFIDGEKVLEEFGVGRFSRAGISHLGQLLDELANTFADLEWAAFFESGTVAGEAFALGN